MGCRDTILDENRQYWTGRASGYSEVNRLELSTAQRQRWSDCLHREIARQFSDRAPETLRVLEVGTGPGFFAILLRELGYVVTAVDLTPAMLEEAKKNAGELAGEICWMEMNAEALDFADESFDVVVSRNLTWNLPHPGKAYAEWARVLKPGGLLLNFDVMEDIARRVPLSNIRRPKWDLALLRGLGLRAEANEQIWQRVWSEEEKLNFASTPLFMVRALRAPMIQR